MLPKTLKAKKIQITQKLLSLKQNYSNKRTTKGRISPKAE